MSRARLPTAERGDFKRLCRIAIHSMADTNQAVLGAYAATMGTTVVIDSTGTIRMNEEYKDGVRFLEVLGSLP